MAPGPTLEQLIVTTETEAPGAEPLDRLAYASQLSGEMTETADELVGHFVEQCRQAGHTWSEISEALGVSRQAVHKRFSDSSLTRFTPRARLAVRVAQEEARARGEAAAEVEHLILGLFSQAEGLAAQALSEVGVTKDAFEGALAVDGFPGRLADPGEGTSPARTFPFGQSAVDNVKNALEEALRLGHNYIGTEHLLLAVYAGDSLGRLILVQLGATEDEMRRRVQEKLAAFTKP